MKKQYESGGSVRSGSGLWLHENSREIKENNLLDGFRELGGELNVVRVAREGSVVLLAAEGHHEGMGEALS